jgi:catechol 2,3-dioxygenase-like lactoylglutathione lyase family enzyme
VSEQVVMSLAVEDIERAKQFYTGGLGFQIDEDHGYFVSFKQERRHRARRLRWQPPRLRCRARRRRRRSPGSRCLASLSRPNESTS